MKRTACVFIRKEPFYRRSAVETGLKRLGYTISDRVVWPSKKEDALVIWNKKAGAEEDRADQWEARGGTVIVMENGYLQQVDKTYYAISAHGHNGSGYYPVGDDLRFPKLGFTLKPWRNGLGEMLVRAQRGVGSRSMASPPQWAEKLVAKFKANKVTARLVPHPGDKNKLALDAAALKTAGILHIWSSAMGVRALVEGVTVIHHAPHWICAGANESNRAAALEKMAWGQWNVDEISSGEPFARILGSKS